MIPFEGKTHGFDIIDPDEIEVKKILDHKEVQIGKNLPTIQYTIELMDGTTIPMMAKDLRCTELINEYNKVRIPNSKQFIEYQKKNQQSRLKELRSGKRVRVGLITQSSKRFKET